MSDEEPNVSGSDGSDSEKKKKKTKGKAKKEKGDEIKKPLSAYMYFTKEKRPEVKKESPKRSFAEIGRILGERWKKLTTEEKAPYEKLRAEDKQRYDEAKGNGGGGRGKKRKKGGGPKRPLSAYMFFAKDQRPVVASENPGADFGELGKILGERWKSLSEEDKEQYARQNTEDKERYKQEYKQWETDFPEEAAAAKEKKKKKKPAKKAKKPKKKKDEDEDDDDGGGDDDGDKSEKPDNEDDE